MLLELEGPFKTVKDRILEASQNKINCLVSNIYNKLKCPALLSHLFRTEKSAGKFQFVVEIAHKEVVLILINLYVVHRTKLRALQLLLLSKKS